jgi:hypothetical protein
MLGVRLDISIEDTNRHSAISGRNLDHQPMSLQAEPTLALEAPVDPASRGQRP